MSPKEVGRCWKFPTLKAWPKRLLFGSCRPRRPWMLLAGSDSECSGYTILSLEPLLRSRKLGANALRALHMPPVRKAIQYIIRSTTFQYSLHVSTYPSQNSCCEDTSTSQHELSFQLLAATCRSSSSCSSNCELYSYIPKLARNAHLATEKTVAFISS